MPEQFTQVLIGVLIGLCVLSVSTTIHLLWKLGSLPKRVEDLEKLERERNGSVPSRVERLERLVERHEMIIAEFRVAVATLEGIDDKFAQRAEQYDEALKELRSDMKLLLTRRRSDREADSVD